MNILLIDTASRNEIVTLNNNKKIHYISRLVDKSHSVTLFNNIDFLMKESGISIKNIDIIGVGIGPGSFTGIRIAVTTARMFAQLLDIPLIGIKTQLIYALSMDGEINDNLLIAFDARKGRVFGAIYKKNSNRLRPEEIVPPGDYHVEYLIKKIDETGKTYSTGNGAAKYIKTLDEQIKNHKYINDLKPTGETASELISELYSDNPKKYSDYNNVVPFYARKSDAEIIRETTSAK